MMFNSVFAEMSTVQSHILYKFFVVLQNVFLEKILLLVNAVMYVTELLEHNWPMHFPLSILKRKWQHVSSVNAILNTSFALTLSRPGGGAVEGSASVDFEHFVFFQDLTKCCQTLREFKLFKIHLRIT